MTNGDELKVKKTIEKLDFKNIYFSWPSGKEALANCSFSIPGPGLWMLVGRNGSGKSTLFKIISGLLQPQHGEISCNLKSSLMFQNPDHQILLPSCGSDLLHNLPANLTNTQIEIRITELLAEVDLEGLASRPIHTLSGGQKQRLALAGALASESQLLLLDEPTALLDPNNQKMVLRTVKKLCHRSKDPLTAIWITHRLDELDHADGAARMENGKVGKWISGKQLRKSIQPLAVRQV